ncbi:MAG: efflux RND transporter permease subunit [Thermomicrobiales bacterium]
MRRIVSWLTEFSYRKSWVIILAILLVSGYGIYTFTRVNQELIPDIEFPVMVLTVQSPGDQPEQVAQNAIAPIEAATAGIEGLQSTESTSVSGFGIVLYSFEFGTSVDQAEDAVQEEVSGLQLGPGVTTNTLTFDPTLLPVVTFDLQGNLDQSELTEIAQSQIVPELSNLDGVASVEVVGGALDQVVITLDRAEMLDRGISYSQVAATLEQNNVILPSGQLQTEGATLPLQTISVYRSIDELRNLPISTSDGSTIALGDIATVDEVAGASVGRTRTNGEPSVSIRVTKLKEANTVDVAHRVTDTLDEIEPTLQDGASIQIFENQAEFIEESIDGVIEEGVIGGVLAIIIVFIFLWNFRSTLITAVSIPLSVIMAIIALDQFGNSLNIMTLAGLTIAIGRVIDDSIVVLENVYRHMAEGEPSFAAVINGAREVTIAIVGATATTCAVFLPLGLIGGLIGELFLPFALAVVFALLGSLIVAVTVIPMLTKYTIAGRVRVEPEKKAGDTRLGRIYTPVLTWALHNRWKTVIVAGVLFVASFALVPFLNVAFLPDSSENVVTISVAAQPGETQQSVLDQTIEIEQLLQDYDIERYQTVITGHPEATSARSRAIISGENPNSATIGGIPGHGEDSRGSRRPARARRRGSPWRIAAAVSVSASGGSSAAAVSRSSFRRKSREPSHRCPSSLRTCPMPSQASTTSRMCRATSASQDTIQIEVDTDGLRI